MDEFVLSKQGDKAVLFHDPLKMMKLKTFSIDHVIKMITSKQFPGLYIMSSYICYIMTLVKRA